MSTPAYKEIDESLDSVGKIALVLGIVGVVCMAIGAVLGYWMAP